MNQAKIQDRGVALVTGGARRIGETLVRTLHAKGFDVVIHCHHSISEAGVLTDELNHTRHKSACVVEADLAKTDVLKALIDEACAWQGRLDVLINNASLFVKTVPGELDDALWEKLWSINVKAPYYLSEYAHKALVKAKGTIINITDIHADKLLKDYEVYVQTKAALKMQTKALARAYAPSVRVNAVAPGAILWPEVDNAFYKALQENIIAKTPLKCHGTPEWIADAVMSLVLNPFITGQTLRVDGGRSVL